MASRRQALKNLDQELKALSRRVPEGEELYEILFGLTAPGERGAAGDRTAAIAASAFVEHGLQQAILTHFRADISNSDKRELFTDPYAPLSGFSAKIVVARSLGILTKNEKEELDTIRNIRNAFAHSMIHIEFSDSPIPKLCALLGTSGRMAFHSNQLALVAGLLDDPKWRFVWTVSQLYWRLATYHPNEPPSASPHISQ